MKLKMEIVLYGRGGFLDGIGIKLPCGAELVTPKLQFRGRDQKVKWVRGVIDFLQRMKDAGFEFEDFDRQIEILEEQTE